MNRRNHNHRDRRPSTSLLAALLLPVMFAGYVYGTDVPPLLAAAVGKWQGWDQRPISLLEQALFEGVGQSRPAGRQLLLNSCVAGGTTDYVRLADYEQRFQRYCQEFANDGPNLSRPPRELAAALFQFMHRRILTAGYADDASDVGQLLASGRYNCISSCVLFNCLCYECGLNPRAIEFPNHVRSLLIVDGQRLEIETTCPDWFHAAIDGSRPASATTRVDNRLGRDVDDRKLAAIVYYNRGVDLLNQRCYADAISVNLRALRLDPANVTARANLLAAVNNWSLALCEAGRYAEALDLLVRARQQAADHPPFRANQLHVLSAWCKSLCEAGKFDQALSLLKSAHQQIADAPAAIDSITADVLRRQSSGITAF